MTHSTLDSTTQQAETHPGLTSSAQPAEPALDAHAVELIRTQAYKASAEGRYEDAIALLESVLSPVDQPTLETHHEVIADLAALAFQQGDLLKAIALARKVQALQPELDVNVFTLALSLSGVGAYAEAQAWFENLSSGIRGQRLAEKYPQLLDIARSESTRLRALSPLSIAAEHKYDFSHLTQPVNQKISGPIQDDEALLFYAVIRGMRLKRILEVGGLNGYSARNFLQALAWDPDTALYTVDINPVEALDAHHHVIQKDVALLTPSDVHQQPLDLVFFDAHVLEPQLDMYVHFVNAGLITNETIIALHDTNLHPYKTVPWAYPIQDSHGEAGYVHQPVERQMVNLLRQQFGYDAFCLHTSMHKHDERLPYRQGVTLLKKFSELRT